MRERTDLCFVLNIRRAEKRRIVGIKVKRSSPAMPVFSIQTCQISNKIIILYNNYNKTKNVTFNYHNNIIKHKTKTFNNRRHNTSDRQADRQAGRATYMSWVMQPSKWCTRYNGAVIVQSPRNYHLRYAIIKFRLDIHKHHQNGIINIYNIYYNYNYT
jgi:hypothetical protein